MRVVDKNTFTLVSRQLQLARERFDKSTQQVNSGKKINRLADDPALLQRTLRHDTQEIDLDRYERTQQEMTARFRTYESLTNEAYQILSAFKSQMIALSNPGNSADAQAELLSQISHVREQLMAIANRQDDGRYLFSGSQTGTAAFADDGTYQGNEIVTEVEILPNVRIESNLTGDRVFGGIGFSDGVNVFNMLDEMEALATGNVQETVSSHIDDVSQVIEQIIQETVTIGGIGQRLEISASTLSQLNQNLAEKRQNFEDADYMTAISEYTAQEFALQAAMQVNSKLIEPSLLNFIR